MATKIELSEEVTIQVVEEQTRVDSAPSLVCKDLGFSVKTRERKLPPCFPATREKVIIDGIDLAFRPGTMTAVMGASGAGKTTLLNALSGRAVGQVTGQVCCRNSETMTFIIQDDVMHQTLTPRENLMYAARLVLPSSSFTSEDRRRRVEELIDAFHLRSCANTVVGIPGEKRGISGGERKRVSIAMSLLSDPALIFVDEPTSGLDSSAAFNVARILRRLADEGRTLVVTIHQPSQLIFDLFTHVCLLSHGHVAFFGPRSDIEEHFASVGCPHPLHANTAGWLIDLVDTNREILVDSSSSSPSPSPAIESSLPRTKPDLPPPHSAEFVEYLCRSYAETPLAKSVRSSAESAVGSLVPVTSVRRPYARSIPMQFFILGSRSALGLWRDRQFIVTRLFQTVVIAGLLAILFSGMKNNQAGIRNRIGFMFFSCMLQLLFAMLSVLFIMPSDLAVLLKEHLNGMYAVPPYMAAKIFVDTPIQIVMPLLYSCIVYWSVKLNGNTDRILIYMAMLVVLANIGSSVGFFISSVTMSLSGSLQIAPAVFIPNVIFSGMILNLNSITKVLRWIQWLSFLKYAFAVLVNNEFRGQTFVCDAGEQVCPLTTGEAVLKLYDLNDVPKTAYFLALIGYIIVFRFASMVAMVLQTRKYKSH